MALIFISYRREDASGEAGRIDDRLTPVFGRENVFIDVDSIPPGTDFGAYIAAKIAACQFVLVVIGRTWSSLIDGAGRIRLRLPDDFVHIEVATALRLNKVVIPVLVQNAAMPQAKDLPPDLHSLIALNAQPARPNPDFHHDVDKIIGYIRDHMLQPTASAPGADVQTFDIQDSLRTKGFVGQRRNGVEAIIPPMITVPGGPFLMGSDKRTDPQAGRSETPQHSVTLPGYTIGKYAVTVAEYQCYAKTRHLPEPRNALERYLMAPQQNIYPDYPQVMVSWSDAVEYARWLSQVTYQRFRLPTEAEWEKAARGTGGRIYPWGNVWESGRSCSSDSGWQGFMRGFKKEIQRSAVGAYAGDVSPYGCYDMAGNVQEYTSSLEKPYPYDANDGREDIHIPVSVDNSRVIRGGCYADGPKGQRTTSRTTTMGGAYYYTGFRIVREL